MDDGDDISLQVASHYITPESEFSFRILAMANEIRQC
jgi:hypothetical protein